MPSSHLYVTPWSLLTLVIAAQASPAHEAAIRPLVRIPIRSNVPSTNVQGVTDDLIFNATFAAQELQTVKVKYARAAQYLNGKGLNPDTHPQRGYASFDPHSSTNDNPVGDGDTGILSGRAPLTDHISGDLDLLYTVNTEFGTPSQPLDIDVDTGSADLWVPVNCRNCANDQLDGAMSSSYMASANKCSTTYGAGAIAGSRATERVSIASLTVPEQTFCAVRKVSQEMNDEPISGLLGLAFGTIANTKKPTFFENLLTQGSIGLPIFSVYLTRKEQYGSELCLGCFDRNKTTGGVTVHPVISRTYWTLSMDSLSVNDTQLPVKISAAIDTGTTLIYVPQDVAQQFYAMIPGSAPAVGYGEGYYTYPCDSQFSVALHFDKIAYSINPADFKAGRMPENPKACVGAIIALGSDDTPNFAIVGTHFLKNWYTVFDYTGFVGFGKSINHV